MAKVNPNSKASRIRRAKALLSGLLKAPKTQAGLIAAAKTKGVTNNFVYGFLANGLRTGAIVKHKSSDPETYQLALHAAIESPGKGRFPDWLEPRSVPPFTGRTAYIDAKKDHE